MDSRNKVNLAVTTIVILIAFLSCKKKCDGEINSTVGEKYQRLNVSGMDSILIFESTNGLKSDSFKLELATLYTLTNYWSDKSDQGDECEDTFENLRYTIVQIGESGNNFSLVLESSTRYHDNTRIDFFLNGVMFSKMATESNLEFNGIQYPELVKFSFENKLDEIQNVYYDYDLGIVAYNILGKGYYERNQ